MIVVNGGVKIGRNPVKSNSIDTYTVLIQDKFGNRIELEAKNYFDRLSFDEKSSIRLHDIIKEGGTIKFKITEGRYRTSIYKFSIEADLYNNAYVNL